MMLRIIALTSNSSLQGAEGRQDNGWAGLHGHLALILVELEPIQDKDNVMMTIMMEISATDLELKRELVLI